MIPLRDPETCPRCHGKARVVESKKRIAGYRRRVHRCGKCRLSWPSYQTTIDPQRILPPDAPT